MITQLEGVWRWFAPSRALEEMSWATEVGDVRAELGEIAEIYRDYTSLIGRIEAVHRQLGASPFAAALKAMQSGLLMVLAAEDEFRQITKSPKSPRRNPIKQYPPSANLRSELLRISTDIGKLSVRVRNIGQDTAHFTVLNIGHVRDTFEEASEVIRRAFVKYEKALNTVIGQD